MLFFSSSHLPRVLVRGCEGMQATEPQMFPNMDSLRRSVSRLAAIGGRRSSNTVLTHLLEGANQARI